MARLFLKSMFVSFLWLIVFVNILFAFNIVNDMPLVGYASGVESFEDRYFGMSTLIKFIQELDITKDFPFLANLKDFITTTQNTMNGALAVDWNQTFSIEVNSLESFFNAFGSFFNNLFRAMGSLFVQISMLVFWIPYFFMYFLGFLGVLLKLLSGNYYSVIPQSGIDLESVILCLKLV